MEEKSSASRGSGTTAFGFYLRTGRRIVQRPAVEVKFNPYHDPEDGRFTFKPGGSSGFGGGGATGSWDGPTSKPRVRTAKPVSKPVRKPPRQRIYSVKAGDSLTRIASFQDGVSAADIAKYNGIDVGATLKVGQTLKVPTKAELSGLTARNGGVGGRTISKNGYNFVLDSEGRTEVVTGSIRKVPDQARSRSSQVNAGGADRLPTDEGGHFIARRFGGPTDAFNHFAQDRNFNRSGYQALEKSWDRAKAAGEKVWVRIEPRYIGNSKRPSSLTVIYKIGDSEFSRLFPNGGGK